MKIVWEIIYEWTVRNGRYQNINGRYALILLFQKFDKFSINKSFHILVSDSESALRAAC